MEKDTSETSERINTLVDRIIKDIHNVISKNPGINSFEIVPVDDNQQNRCPVLLNGICLGLESWCVKNVYLQCYAELMDTHYLKPKRKTSKYTSIVSERLIVLLNITLLLNPDLNSLWNTRRDLVQQLLLDESFELEFSEVVLSRKPKCNDAFAYRRWLVDILLKADDPSNIDVSSIANEELRVCESTSDKSPNNYHSWNHRMWLVKKVKNYQDLFNFNSLLIKEYEFSEHWTTRHVSDFSGFHYRQFCIENLISIPDGMWENFVKSANNVLRKALNEALATHMPKDAKHKVSFEELVKFSDDKLVNYLLADSDNKCTCITSSGIICRKLEILFHEFAVNNDWLRLFKYHETLWCHRRFIINQILLIIYVHYGLKKGYKCIRKYVCEKCNPEEMSETQPKIGRYDEKLFSNMLYKILMLHEERFLTGIKRDCEFYIEKHEAYLRYVECLDLVKAEVKFNLTIPS